MTECFIERGTHKKFAELITAAEYDALPDSDRARYTRAYPELKREDQLYSLKVYTNLDYYGQCGGGTRGSAALPSSSVVDAAFRAEVRARARAPLAASRRAASGPTADDGRGLV